MFILKMALSLFNNSTLNFWTGVRGARQGNHRVGSGGSRISSGCDFYFMGVSKGGESNNTFSAKISIFCLYSTSRPTHRPTERNIRLWVSIEGVERSLLEIEPAERW